MQSHSAFRNGIAWLNTDRKTGYIGVVMRKTVLSFGETLWDLFPSGAALGGAPFNFACRVHALGDRATIVTRLGRDEYGRKALEQIAAVGMDVSHVQKDEHHPTGTVKVTLDGQGNPDFRIVPEA